MKFAQYVGIAVALEMLFNQGKGTEDQRLRAAMWLLGVELEPGYGGRPPKDGPAEAEEAAPSAQDMIRDLVNKDS